MEVIEVLPDRFAGNVVIEAREIARIARNNAGVARGVQRATAEAVAADGRFIGQLGRYPVPGVQRAALVGATGETSTVAVADSR